ncbi:ribokinase [Celerinatantimonas sp. YJH-8]|uniref:ribokinase n=1 Tax=Celerinatantimonas sp. YJH-8 TaxID=3228714 RepID=UPI0038C625EE
MSSLVVIGSINADHLIHIEHFPAPGETCHGNGYRITGGGKGANQAMAAARSGAKVSFIGCMGDDSTGRWISQQLEQCKIDTSGLACIEACATGFALIQIDAKGENTVCIASEANGYLNANYIIRHRQIIAQAKMLLLQLETPLDGVTEAIHQAAQQGVKVILNPAPARVLSDALLAMVDVIIPNQREASVLTGIQVRDELSARRACDVLHQKGIAQVIITLGEKGAWVSDIQGEAYLSPGFYVHAVDSTAAGDTFIGALLGAQLRGLELRQALRFAHAAAALSVTREGAQNSIPQYQDVMLFLTSQPANDEQ